MSHIIQKGGSTYHQCEECKLVYDKKAIAEQCEAWCKEHKSCNIEITKHAVQVDVQTGSAKKEEKMARREERQSEQEQRARRGKLARVLKKSTIVVGIVGVVGLGVWYVASRPPIPEGEIVSRTGLHWHPELAIYVKGVRQTIPSAIGLGGIEMAIHTHDSTGVIHLEMIGLVQKEDIRLGQFFRVWGKDIRSFGTNMKMKVNGKENTEYENYVMQDKDKIELRYE